MEIEDQTHSTFILSTPVLGKSLPRLKQQPNQGHQKGTKDFFTQSSLGDWGFSPVQKEVTTEKVYDNGGLGTFRFATATSKANVNLACPTGRQRWHMHMCVKEEFPTWRACMDGKNERVKIPPRKTRHARFGAGKLRLYLYILLCVLWNLSVFLSILGGSVFLSEFLEDLSGILCDCPGPVTYLRDKRTSDLDLFRATGLLVWTELTHHHRFLPVRTADPRDTPTNMNGFVNWFAEVWTEVAGHHKFLPVRTGTSRLLLTLRTYLIKNDIKTRQ
ncbi:hypothetical protein Bbelb_191930 [Branchiostoma belcheri]|nr:hypothetical protein Bbelb_191930 [Branchiostoma belcheri]